MRNARYIFLVLLVSLISIDAQSQLFPPYQWCWDGYQIGGAISYNVNNSGIDVEISGLAYEECSLNTITTGINNTGSNGIKHRYVFRFSETISVQFKVGNVNYGTGYNDQLVFSGDPVFFDGLGLSFSNDTVHPGPGTFDTDGSMNVYYEAVDSIVIIHGTGQGYNPGFIRIHEIYLNAYPPVLPSTDCFQGNHFMYQDQQSLYIEKVYSDVIDLHLVNEIGQYVPIDFEQDDTIVQLPVGQLSRGMYYIIVVLDCGQVIREKVVLR